MIEGSKTYTRFTVSVVDANSKKRLFLLPRHPWNTSKNYIILFIFGPLHNSLLQVDSISRQSLLTIKIQHSRQVHELHSQTELPYFGSICSLFLVFLHLFLVVLNVYAIVLLYL